MELSRNAFILCREPETRPMPTSRMMTRMERAMRMMMTKARRMMMKMKMMMRRQRQETAWRLRTSTSTSVMAVSSCLLWARSLQTLGKCFNTYICLALSIGQSILHSRDGQLQPASDFANSSLKGRIIHLIWRHPFCPGRLPMCCTSSHSWTSDELSLLVHEQRGRLAQGLFLCLIIQSIMGCWS